MKKGLNFFYLPQPIGLKSVQSLDENSNYYDMLANYITGNIMSDKRVCEELLQDIQNVENGTVKVEDLDGNACFGSMTKEKVEIGILWSDGSESTTYPLHIFKKAVEEWRDFIITGKERILEFDYPDDEDS